MFLFFYSVNNISKKEKKILNKSIYLRVDFLAHQYFFIYMI